MQDDLTDAVKWAIAQGITTADQVAIYGASYGGYATLAGLTFTPELYRCGINYVGPADLQIQLADYKISPVPAMRMFAFQRVGADRAYLHDRSPLNFIERIHVPLLNAYGYNDARVNIRQWEVLEPKLKKYGKTYEIIVNDKEGHGFYNETARLDFYHRMDAFLTKYLPVK
jgi:dipeptidyl aminopeptidase/acylaminoacyl peptidase